MAGVPRRSPRRTPPSRGGRPERGGRSRPASRPGGEGFLDVKGAKGDAHKIIIALSNLFTTPLATGVPFNWKDLTPVKMMALDQFVLWVNAETPYKTAKDYIDEAKARANDP